MASMQAAIDKDRLPGAPPLFVTSYSKAGVRQEALVESGQVEPGWLDGAPQVRIQTPGGRTWSGRMDDARHGSIYERLLEIVGGREVAWAATVLGGKRQPDEEGSGLLKSAVSRIRDIELWTRESDETPVSHGPLYILHTSAGHVGGSFQSFAVVRRTDKSVVHVANTGQFYIDLLPAEGGSEAVPRALVDTGLAGAFWGYTEHQVPAASRCAAGRLLATIFDERREEMPAAWIAAAAHAVLTHDDFLPAYGVRVLKLLRSKHVPTPDATFLNALIGIAMIASGNSSDREAVHKDIRAAIAVLARERVTYGETLRWLDDKFLAIRAMAERELSDETLEADLSAISAWLGTSYAGGQIAAYAGEAPISGKGWHDALAEKKTPPL